MKMVKKLADAVFYGPWTNGYQLSNPTYNPLDKTPPPRNS